MRKSAILATVALLALAGCGKGEADKASAASTGNAYAVASPALNCRVDRNPNALVVEQLPKDTLITATEEAGGWVKTHRDAGDCWVNGAFLTLNQTGSVAPPQEAAVSQAASVEQVQTADGSRVHLVSEGGIYKVPVMINDTIQLGFAVDSGASDVVIPADVFSTLVRAGTIKDEDMIGQQTYSTADGSTHTAATFRIRSLKVGGWEVKDVEGSVGEPQAPMLLGQTFLKRFRSWSIDNNSHELVLK